MEDVELIIEAAEVHGRISTPDMEVGDLQQLSRDLWGALTPSQRKSFLDRKDNVVNWKEFITYWRP